MHYRAHWRRTERESERERETVYAHPFGKIKVTNASADRQGELFLAYSSTSGTFFLQISICGNALTVSEFQCACRSLQNTELRIYLAVSIYS